jgi:hypothetical protein
MADIPTAELHHPTQVTAKMLGHQHQISNILEIIFNDKSIN